MTNCNEDNTADFVKLVPFGVGNVLVADTTNSVFIGEFEKVCSEEDATGVQSVVGNCCLLSSKSNLFASLFTIVYDYLRHLVARSCTPRVRINFLPTFGV